MNSVLQNSTLNNLPTWSLQRSFPAPQYTPNGRMAGFTPLSTQPRKHKPAPMVFTSSTKKPVSAWVKDQMKEDLPLSPAASSPLSLAPASRSPNRAAFQSHRRTPSIGGVPSHKKQPPTAPRKITSVPSTPWWKLQPEQLEIQGVLYDIPEDADAEDREPRLVVVPPPGELEVKAPRPRYAAPYSLGGLPVRLHSTPDLLASVSTPPLSPFSSSSSSSSSSDTSSPTSSPGPYPSSPRRAAAVQKRRLLTDLDDILEEE